VNLVPIKETNERKDKMEWMGNEKLDLSYGSDRGW
jgi:hypothetical protein